jgi:hypothetical protein
MLPGGVPLRRIGERVFRHPSPGAFGLYAGKRPVDFPLFLFDALITPDFYVSLC